ncbi:hypothetical protein ACWT_5746 [Actinoplanes sp. SE50]|uniref:hypothetical protein n=1 Tax=unclassified Actinoplanes TaxID=2626549 RepID=UPI00023ED4CE|nr:MULTISPECIES: hypothetical protein [unclassified Actinoplanes]AEV86764.1 hypothetical protein ACPL_5877 [Actinoplanes sp. SE50/110]ATO85161.1 hypothetical protein ACWT_5746 [Actinoplanes sp. SE50]SLM02571.1 hypothetical protein ACSP50_5853 [Actinoplanes sp. SE50/110]
MNLFTVTSGILLGAPTAYTGALALSRAVATLAEITATRHEVSGLPTEPFAARVHADRRRGVAVAGTSLALVAGIALGVVLAVTVADLFWVGISGAALCAIAYWAAVRPRQTALRQPMSGADG